MKKAMITKPPMGWNSYDYYDTTVNEADIRENAEYMAKNLKEYGWEYVVIDIEWYSYAPGTQRERFQYIPFGDVEMDEYSRLLPCPERFPSSVNGAGFKPLADYVHSLGLKFGIHIMRGIPRIAAHTHSKILGSDKTANEIADPYSICYWNPDMYGVYPLMEASQQYYNSIMDLYASWGVDFIKCDDICRMDARSSKQEIEMLHKAIIQTGREIVLSLSPGAAKPDMADFYKENAEMWRITDDFWDRWDLLLDMFSRCRTWQNDVSDGNYPDCDMLPLGYLGKGFGDERVTRLTKDEQITMMNLWCIFRSPLMLGAYMPKLDDFTLGLLTNKKVLSLLDGSHGAKEIYNKDGVIVWSSKANEGNASYYAIFNVSDEEQGVVPNEVCGLDSENAEDLWNEKNIDISDMMTMRPHASILIRI